ncbi:MAG: response regulator [Pseudomonadota bacterium]
MSALQDAEPPQVIIVEDEDNIALALMTVLGREGWRLTRFADGAEGLATIEERQPDLVLLDVMLPSLSGYEICQRIRMSDNLTKTRILMMTARGTSVERRKGLALGADAFITKPFDLRDLMGQVRRLLSDQSVILDRETGHA